MTLSAREEQALSLTLVAPAFAYLLLLLLSGYTGWTGATVAGFVLIPLLILVGLIPLWGPFIELLGFTALTLGILDVGLSTPGAGPLIDFVAGVLLGSPFLLGTWAWTPRRSAPARLLGLGVALMEGIILLAALRLIQANNLAETSASLFYNYTLANLYQACGIAGFLNVVPNGCPLDLTHLPLRDLVDPVFVVLSGIALLGVLMPVLSPRTGRGAPGETESFDEFESSSRVRADLALSPEMMRGLAQRTPPRPSPGLAPPGSAALLLSALFVLLFVAYAISAPSALLLPTMLSLFFALLAVLYLGRAARTPARLPPEVLVAAPQGPPTPPIVRERPPPSVPSGGFTPGPVTLP